MSEDTQARQIVVFTLGAEQYALPIKQVQEIIRYKEPRSVASNDSSARGVISLRGRIVPVYDLAYRLAVTSELGEHTKIVILETAEQTIGVIVDAVDEVLTVEERELEEIPGADTTLMDAVAKLGERLVVLLNPSTIFATASLAAALT
jgi:purine-binding chemotaxis protein CheW